jgi:hypothetical protein
MKRLALLVAHPGEIGKQNYLAVDKDIDNWRNHLMSPLGGNWREEEILVLLSPEKYELEGVLAAWKYKIDYSIIAFSGHGAFSESRNDTIIQINSRESFEGKKLHLSKKEIIVFDCCHEVVDKKIQGSLTLESVQASAKIDFPNPHLSRRAFNTAVKACPDGAVILHSSSLNELAYDDEFGRGGAYTFNLLQAARRWWPDEILNENEYKKYSVVAAHDVAANQLSEDERTPQHPTIKKARSGPYLPISIWI